MPHEVKRLIREFGVGQVILFRRNVESPEQVAELVRELQSAARDARLELPVLVAVDQEGGRVARLREPWTVWPPGARAGPHRGRGPGAADGRGPGRGAGAPAASASTSRP